MSEIIPECPICGKTQRAKPIKSWKYGKMIITRTVSETKWGPSINCSRYMCKCGKSFNFYRSGKGKIWTVPKKKLHNT